VKVCGHEEFGKLRDALEKEGKKFTKAAMKRLCYGDLFLAIIGNAGEAAGQSVDQETEEQERLSRFAGMDADALAEATFCDDHESYAAFQRLADAMGPLPDEAASPEVLLYRNMTRLRGDWSDGRDSDYLKEIYRLVEVCKQRGELPIGWLVAVKLNADTFDGHFNDGRIMRDGGYHLPDEIVKAMGLPAEMARGCSGNLAKAAGAVPNKEGGYSGSYEELLKKALLPEQRVEFMRRSGEDD
jgi:hypothetical protein